MCTSAAEVGMKMCEKRQKVAHKMCAERQKVAYKMCLLHLLCIAELSHHGEGLFALKDSCLCGQGTSPRGIISCLDHGEGIEKK